MTTLILKREHRRLGHGGPQTVLYNVRLQYWPLDVLREIKRITHSCLICFRLKTHSSSQITADLPKERVTPSRPFQNTGIDFGGPLILNQVFALAQGSYPQRLFTAICVPFYKSSALRIGFGSFLGGLSRVPKTVHSSSRPTLNHIQ